MYGPLPRKICKFSGMATEHHKEKRCSEQDDRTGDAHCHDHEDNLGRNTQQTKDQYSQPQKMTLEWGKRSGKDVVLGRLEGRRKRCEGEGAWENRRMAQVPFYNSGDLWHDACTSVQQYSLVTSFPLFSRFFWSRSYIPQKAAASCFIMGDDIYLFSKVNPND